MNSTSLGTNRFTTTHWSVVLAASSSSSAHYEEALSSLCQTYWFPLYAYLRKGGYDTHLAEDYIQAFFLRMLEKQYLSKVEQNRGKFRSFLLVALKRFVADQHDLAHAFKRGGGQKRLSIDIEFAEGKYALEPVSDLSPERIFEKSWALAVLEHTMAHLKAEFTDMNKQKLFDCLKVYIGGELKSVPYRKVAADLNMTEDAVKAAVYRLRKRYRQQLRDIIAQTVTTHEQINEEIQDLFVAIAD
jgi:DNA-directed RNA polymerase specialized sigma24 family protein